jgi:hypothetical protein
VKERDHFEDPSADWRIILKLILKKRGVSWSRVAQESALVNTVIKFRIEERA